MPAQSVDISIDVGADNVGVVELRRPPNNFFDIPLLKNLADVYEELDGNPQCRVVLLCSEGKHFCAGARFRPGNAASPTGGSAGLYAEAVRLFQARKPVVAAVQGSAVGGGLGLACAADFRVGTPQSRFSANFAQLGFHHGFGLSLTLPWIVGNQAALDLLYTGRRISGERALAIGLCDRLAPADEVREAARDLAREIASSAPLAVESIRHTMRGGLADAFRQATLREGEEQIRLRATEDFLEGIAASAERRKPLFAGR